MEIKRRKPRVINLRKKTAKLNRPVVKVSVPVEEISERIEVKSKEWVGGSFPCVDCGAKEAIEFGRCKACDTSHRELASRLDSRPKTQLEKVQPKFTVRKEVSGGVVVTVQTLEPLR